MTHPLPRRALLLIAFLLAPASAFAERADRAIVLIASHGEVLHLETDIKTVLVADPDIANVQLVSPRVLFIFGQSTGVTEFYILDGEDRVIFRRSVTVNRPLSQMHRLVGS